MRTTQQLAFLAVLAVMASLTGLTQAETVVLTPVADNTLIEDPLGAWSLGAAQQFYAGRVGKNGGSTLRRAVVRFDVAAAIPAGSTITSATLLMNLSATQTGTFSVGLYLCLASWGEGTSTGFGGGGAPSATNDATWIHRFYPGTPWATPGGSFSATASATKSVGGVGFYTWGPTTEMTANVQAWRASPSTNFGWVVRGNEVTLQSVKRFDSRESPANRPQLTITFTPPSVLVGDLDGGGSVNAGDLGILLAKWGTSDAAADIDDDGVVGASDLAALVANWT
ncbi:MAG: DNRLRE domain-containing protein [Phycisphaerales bacterium]|nr:DNRLRE domain-containing protein [Phycisphaerales bacterium]